MKIPKNISSGGGCMRTPISPWPTSVCINIRILPKTVFYCSWILCIASRFTYVDQLQSCRPEILYPNLSMTPLQKKNRNPEKYTARDLPYFRDPLMSAARPLLYYRPRTDEKAELAWVAGYIRRRLSSPALTGLEVG